MTLDEAIKYAEEIAENEEKSAGYFYDKESATYKKKVVKRAEEHRQLAEWLKDYKRLKEQKPCVNIPFLLHKETDCPLYECVEAYEKAYEYLRSKAIIIG